jgi:hypothetical protein
MPFSAKTVSGIRDKCSVMAARITLKMINDALVRRGHNARLERRADIPTSSAVRQRGLD